MATMTRLAIFDAAAAQKGAEWTAEQQAIRAQQQRLLALYKQNLAPIVEKMTSRMPFPVQNCVGTASPMRFKSLVQSLDASHPDNISQRPALQVYVALVTPSAHNVYIHGGWPAGVNLFITENQGQLSIDCIREDEAHKTGTQSHYSSWDEAAKTLTAWATTVAPAAFAPRSPRVETAPRAGSILGL